MKNYFTFNARIVEEDDLKVVSLSHTHTLSVLSNKSGLLIQSNCNRTEYLCGQPCEQLRLTAEGE